MMQEEEKIKREEKRQSKNNNNDIKLENQYGPLIIDEDGEKEEKEQQEQTKEEKKEEPKPKLQPSSPSETQTKVQIQQQQRETKKKQPEQQQQEEKQQTKQQQEELEEGEIIEKEKPKKNTKRTERQNKKTQQQQTKIKPKLDPKTIINFKNEIEEKLNKVRYIQSTRKEIREFLRTFVGLEQNKQMIMINCGAMQLLKYSKSPNSCRKEICMPNMDDDYTKLKVLTKLGKDASHYFVNTEQAVLKHTLLLQEISANGWQSRIRQSNTFF